MTTEKLDTSEKMIKECIVDLYLTPRDLMMKWSKITNQTFNARMAYPSQHLASVITGIKGKGTAARGEDLSDGTEVKSCSRADQLSECRNCGAKILVLHKKCPICNSNDINVKTDSHWIFSIRSEDELNLLLNRIPRIILILFDKSEDRTDIIRLRAWRVDPKVKHVHEFFNNYFYENYRKKTNPAPCNLHPLMYDFYLMKPRLIFHAELNIENKAVDIKFWDTSNSKPEKMPINLLTNKEIKQITDKKEIKSSYVPETLINKLKIREKKVKKYKKKYVRR